MGDDITIGVTEIVNNIEVTAQPSDQIIELSVIDNADDVTLNITPTVVEININKGSSYAKWGDILGNLPDQADLQNVLNLKADLVGGLVPASQLPSYVDDIVEVANYAALPVVGETGKIYLTLDNNKIFRWSGSVYIEIAANNAIWGAITGTLSSQIDLQNALDLKANDNSVVHLAGSETITGIKTFTGNSTIFDYSGASRLLFKTDGTEVADFTFNSFFTQISSKASGGYLFKNSTNGNSLSITDAGSGTFLGSVTATSIIKSGGTSSQFLKANGSVDSNVYALDSVVVKLSGDQTIAGVKTFSSDVKSTAFRLTGGTAGTGLYYGHTNKVVLANYTVGGGIDFETNGGDINMTLNELGNLFVRHNLITGNASDTVNNLFRIDTNKAIFQIEADGATSGAGTKIKYTYGSGAQGSLRFVRALDEDTMILAANGNVGIGITSPYTKLEMVGAATNWENSPSIIFTDNTGTADSRRWLIGNVATNYGSLNFAVSSTNSDAPTNPKMTITKSGDVGIGVTSTSSYKLFVAGGQYGTYLRGGDLGTGSAALNVVKADNSSALYVRGDGNIGIGETSPSEKLTIQAGNIKLNSLQSTSGDYRYIGTEFATNNGNNKAEIRFAIDGADTYTRLQFHTANGSGNIGERMRITSGGNVLVGTTDTGFNARQLIRFDASGASTNGLAIWNGGGSGASFTVFANSGGAFIGSITQVGTTAVAYNVTSDYRLKQDFKPFNGLELVSQIKVYDYEWKSDKSRMNGVIAHELQEVVPYAVTGEKDAKEMQQVDYSKLVPILVQAIQELNDKINKLENK